MKRTRTTRLLLMGLSPFILAACNNSSSDLTTQRQNAGDERLFPNVEACVQSGEHPEEDCRAAFAAAWEEHQTNAPRYETAQACAEQHGEAGCAPQQTSSGGSFFMPMMVGMLMGRAFNTGFARPAYYGKNQPFTGGSGKYWSGGTNPVLRPGMPGGQQLPPPPAAPGKVVTQARSGFGSQNTQRGFAS